MKKRSDIEEKYKWNLDDYYKDNQWDKELSALTKLLSTFEKYNGKLKDKVTILQCLKKEDEFSKRLEKLYVYASLRRDENLADNSSQIMCNKVMTLSSQASMATSFIVAQLNKLDNSFIDDIINDENFVNYKRYFEQLKKATSRLYQLPK